MDFQKRLASLLVAAAVMVACGTATPGIEGESTPAAIEGDAQTVATPATEAGAAAPGAEGALGGEMPTMPELGENVVTTDSGLQYEDTVVGEGTEAQTGDIVSVHYSGFLEDGTMFDSSVTSGQPLQFTIGSGQVIEGWDQGVAGMQIGGKRTLVIPADLGYGVTGSPPTIPPNAPLTFEVELLDVQTPPEPTSVEEGDYTTTESGLQYVILTEGEGEEVEEGQMVTVNYNGWVEGGTLFDSSEQSGQPIQFIVGDTQLEGLNEGTVGMKVGETRQLRIPAELAFGAEGAGEMIPPDSAIIFELELLEIQDVPEMTEVEEEEYTTTESGLEYTILSEGEGDVAETGDTVAVHYTGFFEDGSVFDSSITRGEPLTFTIGSGQVIPGWEEGVTGMKVGELRQLRVPPELGYGEQGFGSIPPDATLLFQVELVEIVTGNE